MNLLLIGAGQLGSRHLQSCLKHNSQLNIFVVDNVTESIQLAKSRANEIENSSNHKVKYYSEMEKIKESEFQYLIVATGASARFNVLKKALTLFSFKYAILEKVLFQNINDYHNATELVRSYGVTAYVNCPLRTYPFFKEIKEKYIKIGTSIKLKYSGGEWTGLACNSIHYIDLLRYLSGEKLISINIKGLDKGYIDSKRPGNIEFTGNIKGEFSSGSNIFIESIRNSDLKSTIEIVNNETCIKIDEMSGVYSIFENDQLIKNDTFSILYQSDLTHMILNQIESKGECELIKFENSVEDHKILLGSLLKHYNKTKLISSDILPIT